MPEDPPTTSAADPGPSGATFRGGAERVDESTEASPVTPPGPAATPGEPGAGPSPAPSSGLSSGPSPAPSLGPDPRPRVGDPADTVVTRPGPAEAAHKSADTKATGTDRVTEKRTGARPGKVRARKVRRIVRHIEPWSVLKLSLLFYAALFLIICVASALLWGAARGSGAVDNVESFITSVGGFGNCEPIDGAAPTTTTTVPGAGITVPVDPAATSTTVPDPGATDAVAPGDEEDCRDGERLVGEFRFEDGRIFQAFALGGIVLVLAGSAANVVLVLLFNLMSDLTGGVRVTVLEEDPPARPRTTSGSPPPRPRD